MIFTEINLEERKKKILEIIERIKDFEVCDLFTEFKKDYPEITISLKMFSEFIDDMEREGEIKW